MEDFLDDLMCAGFLLIGLTCYIVALSFIVHLLLRSVEN